MTIASMRRRLLRGTVGEKPVSAINELRPSVHLRAHGTPVVGRAHCGAKFLSLKRVNRCCKQRQRLSHCRRHDAKRFSPARAVAEALGAVGGPWGCRRASWLLRQPSGYPGRRRLIVDGGWELSVGARKGRSAGPAQAQPTKARELQRFGSHGVV